MNKVPGLENRMTEEDLQEIVDMLTRKSLLTDDEILDYLKADAPKLIAEVRQLNAALAYIKFWGSFKA